MRFSIILISLLFTMGGSLAFSLMPNEKAACKSATECKGSLPKLCIKCPEGKGGGCAHWSCVDNHCKVATCDVDAKKDSR